MATPFLFRLVWRDGQQAKDQSKGHWRADENHRLPVDDDFADWLVWRDAELLLGAVAWFVSHYAALA